MRESHDIICCIELKKRYFQAILFTRISFFIFIQYHFQRGREIDWSNQPIRETFSTEFSTIQILMCVEQDTDVIFSSFPHNFSQLLKISIIIFSLFWLKSLPRYKQSDGSESPLVESNEIISAERGGRIKVLSLRIEWELLINNIDSMIEHESASFIGQVRSNWIGVELAGCASNQQYYSNLVQIIHIIINNDRLDNTIRLIISYYVQLHIIANLFIPPSQSYQICHHLLVTTLCVFLASIRESSLIKDISASLQITLLLLFCFWLSFLSCIPYFSEFSQSPYLFLSHPLTSKQSHQSPLWLALYSSSTFVYQRAYGTSYSSFSILLKLFDIILFHLLFWLSYRPWASSLSFNHLRMNVSWQTIINFLLRVRQAHPMISSLFIFSIFFIFSKIWVCERLHYPSLRQVNLVKQFSNCQLHIKIS